MSEGETFYTVDRMEGEIAVLVADDGAARDVPGHALPMRVAAGLVLRVRLVANGEPQWSTATIDDTERARRLRQAGERLERLRRTDPGGDVVL
ncbi:MAG TPA: DUF3006 domain-containing protein [Gemmatimonadales bacterium]|nr:DUF3006 domain-containing protein [Gemmatimonadales bacterium]